MTDFDYDCRQKKLTARSAFHKKSGMKSKRCILPSDLLTPAQQKKLNGKVVSYNMREPMTWAEFKALPESAQSEYIRSLLQSYHVTAKCIAEMLGISAETFSRFLQASHPQIEFQRGHRMSKEDMLAWNQFVCNTVDGCPPPSSDEPHETVDESDNRQSPQMNMNGFSIRFSGEIDLNMICNSLRYILGENGKYGDIEIHCSNLSA